MRPTLMRGVLPFLFFTAVGMTTFLFFGQGAYLTCSVERSAREDYPDCYLRKQTIWKGKEDKFSRAGIVAVQLSVATVTSQRSKTSEDFWDIKFRTGSNLPLTLKGVAWPKGSLSLRSARLLLLPQGSGAAPSRDLRLISYGLLPWILGVLAGSIGWVLLLVAMAKPVTNVSADELRRARVANFVMLMLVTSGTVAAWLTFFHMFEKFLAP